MATATVSSPSKGDRIELAKLAAEEISALVATCRGLRNLDLDETQQRLVQRALLTRVEELSDVAWTSLADDGADYGELKARFELSGPIGY